MGDVIDISKYRPQRPPTITCGDCKHVWSAAGRDAQTMECPKCGSIEDVPVDENVPADDGVLRCNKCNGGWFIAHPEWLMCVGCGKKRDHTPDED